MPCTCICSSAPEWIWPLQPSCSHNISTSPPSLYTSSQLPSHGETPPNFTFSRHSAGFCLSPKPQSSVKHGFHATDISPRKKKTHISMLALRGKSTMGIKPPSWVTSVRQILIPRRAMVSGIPLMHGSYDEGKNKGEREMVHATELSSQADLPFGLAILCTEQQFLLCRYLWLTQLTFLFPLITFLFL